MAKSVATNARIHPRSTDARALSLASISADRATTRGLSEKPSSATTVSSASPMVWTGETAMFHATPKIRNAAAMATVQAVAHSRPTTSNSATARLPSMASAASRRDERSVSRHALSPYLAASTKKKPAIATTSAALARYGALMRSSAITMLMSAPIEALRRAATVERRMPCRTSNAAAKASRKPTRGAGDSAAPRGLTSASTPSRTVAPVRPTTSGPLRRNWLTGEWGAGVVTDADRGQHSMPAGDNNPAIRAVGPHRGRTLSATLL